jgi:phytoene dehydrogenase-like protein
MVAERHDVVVVGAGLAGLRCAREVARGGLGVVVLEAADAVGGRVRTDRVDGFRLDRGFQVLNDGYPAVRASVDLVRLDLRRMDDAVVVRHGGRRHRLGNPWPGRPTPWASPPRRSSGGTRSSGSARTPVLLRRSRSRG